MISYQKSLLFLLENLAEKSVLVPAMSISHITNDSRDVSENTLFIAYHGEKSDGRKYMVDAIKKGAVAIAYEPSDDFMMPNINIPCIAIQNLKAKQSLIAARFYDFPSEKIPVMGVTGTNGKTSITHFIAQALNPPDIADAISTPFFKGGGQCGVIGTMGYGFLSHLKKTPNTTPGSIELQKIFFDLEKQGAETIAMEVSSHALVQQRVDHILFHTAVFTNLTQDHLDYHKTMENYRDAKELLFKNLSEARAAARASYLPNAVINIDDETGKYFSQQYKNKLNIITYAMHDKSADIFVLKCTSTQNGFQIKIKTPWGTDDFHLPLMGAFNIHNALATLGVLALLKMPFHTILEKLSRLKAVSGRMELWQHHNSPTIVIDYAHTPDALEKVLQAVRAYHTGKLICVFGCGGDRDKTKRPLMGAIAEKFSDHIIITNDNPRSENPQLIAEEILAGVTQKNKFEITLDRAKAIATAIHSASSKDWVVIAGKGHETEQIIGEHIGYHSDQECVNRLIQSE